MTRATILVPYDFHALSERALAIAEELAGPLDADVVLLHVHHPPVLGAPDVPPSVAARLYTDSVEATKRAVLKLTKRTSLPVLVREGDPATRILETIDGVKPILVIMGTHGRKRLSRFILGSVAEHVVRRSPVPVMTVRTPEPAPPTPP